MTDLECLFRFHEYDPPLCNCCWPSPLHICKHCGIGYQNNSFGKNFYRQIQVVQKKIWKKVN